MSFDNRYIYRHEVYVQRRIQALLDLYPMRHIPKSTVYSIVRHVMYKAPVEKNLPKDALEIVKEFAQIIQDWNFYSDGDIFGFLYHSLESREEKNNMGRFYTPSDIVETMIGRLFQNDIQVSEMRILDPACGTGQFLFYTYKFLLDRLMKDGFKEADAKKYIIKNILYGSDIDSFAVEIAKHNLFLLSGYKSDKIVVNDFIQPRTLFNKALFNQKFTAIIGNPPWGASISESDKKEIRKSFLSASSGINTFTLFIERALELLTEKGRICFLIPDAYLNIKAHCASRKIILDNTAIEEIHLWGERFKNVFAPSITFIARKAEEGDRDSNIVKIMQSKSGRAGSAVLVPQNSFRTAYQNIFNINYSHRAETIIEKLGSEATVSLKDNATFFLGIVTGNNAEALTKERSKKYPDPIIIGKDVGKYTISYSGNYFKYCPDTLQQVAPKDLYTQKSKILYRFIGKGLTFAHDRSGSYTLNNVNGMILNNKEIDADYLVAVLNSKVMQYYYKNTFFTLKVLKGNLEQLPIKLISKTDTKRISEYSQIISYGDEEDLRRYTAQIDDMLLSSYGIKDREALRIMEP